ncbi:hypothetical protein O8H94_000988 [Escherichia coli O157]|nr:hypothetical protein [Escherichia coli O157]EKH6014426.1 hypothetical protein [Escherichia coli O157]EKH6024456.1 hypothetical protein [Escherichia coli O157]EKH6093892.1 hypothetical protein [Escherichia coli O157]
MKTLTKLFVAVAILFGGFIGSVHANQTDFLYSRDVFNTASRVYMAMNEFTSNDLEEMGVDFGEPKELPGVKSPTDPKVKLRVADFEVFNPGYRTYARVRVLVDPTTNTVVGAEYLDLGR